MCWRSPCDRRRGPRRARAFDEHDLPVGQLEDALHPVPKPLLDPGRIQPREDPSQRVVRRDPVRQFQERTQSGSVEFAEEGDGHETAGSTDDRQHGQHQDVRQVVRLSLVDPRLPGLSRSSTRDGDIRPSLREFSAG